MIVLPFEKYYLLGYFAAGLALALLIGLVLVVWKKPARSLDAFLFLLAPVFGYILGVVAFFFIINSPWHDWNACRLAPTISLFHGYRLYYGPHTGPMYNTIYPPMSYLTYLPAGLFGKPSSAIMTAEVLNLLMIVVPILVICFSTHGDTGQSRVPLFSTFAFFGLWRISQTLNWFLTEWVHADSPAAFYGMLACAVLYARRFEANLSWRTAVASTFFAVMALWSKQTIVPLLAVLPLWILFANGARAFARYCVALAANLSVLSILLYSSFGRRRLTFNIIDIPRNHGWYFESDYAKGFGVIAVELLVIIFPLLAAIPILAYLARREHDGTTNDTSLGARFEALRVRLHRDYWILFASVAAAMVPVAMMSRIKIGGNINNYAFIISFVGVACFVMLMDWFARNRERGLESANDALKLLVILSPLSPLWIINSAYVFQFNDWKPLAENPQDVAYRYAKAHPGDAYFPWNPLSGLMLDGKATHFEYGMVDRTLANFPPSPEHVRMFIPEHTRVVAFSPMRQAEWTITVLPEFKRRVEIKELPGWICYER